MRSLTHAPLRAPLLRARARRAVRPPGFFSFSWCPGLDGSTRIRSQWHPPVERTGYHGQVRSVSVGTAPGSPVDAI